MKKQLCVALVCAWILGGCTGGEHVAEDEHAHKEEAAVTKETSDAHGGEALKLDAEQEKIAGIKTEQVAARVMQQTISAPGVVRSTAKGRAMVTPPVGGRVKQILVAVGQSVVQGQTLAVIESSELAQVWSSIADAERARLEAVSALKEAKSEVRLAQEKLASSRTNLSRQREFARAGAFSQAPVQLAQSELNDAQSELLGLQKEQASHADVVRRLETLYRDGIVSRAEFEAAKLELQQDEIKLDRATARVSAAKTTYDRERNIASRGLLNAKEVQTSEAETRAADLEVDRSVVRLRSAEAAVASAQRAVSNARAVYLSTSAGSSASVGQVALKAPISGVVTHLDVTTGQAVDRTQVLMEIENLNNVWVTASVPEKEASRIRKGTTVRVVLPAFPGREYSGVVEILGERVEPKSRAIPVQCLVRTTRGELKPEMFATVHLAYGPSRKALSVASTAVVKEGEKNIAYVKGPQGYSERAVVLGERFGGHVHVVSGLEEGEEVVVDGAFILASEAKKEDLKGHEH